MRLCSTFMTGFSIFQGRRKRAKRSFPPDSGIWKICGKMPETIGLCCGNLPRLTKRSVMCKVIPAAATWVILKAR